MAIVIAVNHPAPFCSKPSVALTLCAHLIQEYESYGLGSISDTTERLIPNWGRKHRTGICQYFPSKLAAAATSRASVNPVCAQAQMDNKKRPSSGEDGPPSKKFKGSPETPGSYSDAVRKKLESASRTGQACDRCKVGPSPLHQSLALLRFGTDMPVNLRSGRCDVTRTLPAAYLVNRRTYDVSPPIESRAAHPREVSQIDWRWSLWH